MACPCPSGATAMIPSSNLPVASGIGGGSADAAATLRAFLLEWPRENIKLSDFVELAKTLGADVPVCFFGHSSWMYGIGDGIERTDLPELHAVLVNPGVAVSTRDVFAALRDKSGTDIIDWPQDFRDADAVIDFLKIVRNDMEATSQDCDFDVKAKSFFLRTNVKVLLKHFDVGAGSPGTPKKTPPVPGPPRAARTANRCARGGTTRDRFDASSAGAIALVLLKRCASIMSGYEFT